MFRNLFFIFLLLLPLFANESEDESSFYELGNGLQLGNLPLYIGGYASLDYKKSDDASRYRVDDIALMSYGNYDKFSYMAEFEFKEFYTFTQNDDKPNTTEKNTKLHTERLYLEYNINENYILRFGKYNTPIGYWNMLPVNVLRDTSSNPMSTELLFPKFITGAAASYTSYGDSDIVVDVLLQQNDAIDDSYNNYKMDSHYGVGVTYTKDDLSLKLNLGNFHNIEDKKRYSYAMISAKYTTQSIDISGELGTQKSEGEFTTKYAGYLQSVYNFSDQHLGIIRLESYDDKKNNEQDNIAIVGYTYRPLYPVALKAEYQLHSLHTNNQFLCSFSVMF